VAESFILHFRGPGVSEVEREVARICTRVQPYTVEWCFGYPPAAGEDGYSVLVYAYPDIFDEYAPAELERLVAEMGGAPTASIAVELRRSRGAEAVGAAAAVARHLLSRCGGIVDDTYSELWRLPEIEEGAVKRDGGFLECYRHPRPAM
jgi:hypothetical protein